MGVRIINADVLDGLAQLPDESVHCVVTSPPYFGLRDYGIEGQIGLEPTPDAYVSKMVKVFREVRRVLRKDGTCWLNLGDSYASTSIGGGAGQNLAALADKWAPNKTPRNPNRQDNGTVKHASKAIPPGCKPKDLIGIPWRVAFALQADGWWLRQDIIWSKPNPMPESVTDRCTKAHEYLFLLTKDARYFYDAEAIAEACVYASEVRVATPKNVNGLGRNPTREYGHKLDGNRNKRSVWEVTTQPFPEAHFATFPPALIEPCIKAGCPYHVCKDCGAPWAKEIERGETTGKRTNPGKPSHLEPQGYLREGKSRCGDATRIVRGTAPTCECNWGYTTARGVVLDPFGGSGTTGLVADRLGRQAILIELNPEYAAMAQRRISNDCPMFAEVSP